MEFYTKHAALMSLSELFTIRYPSDPICTVKEVKKKHLYTQAKSEARIGMFEASLIKSWPNNIYQLALLFGLVEQKREENWGESRIKLIQFDFFPCLFASL